MNVDKQILLEALVLGGAATLVSWPFTFLTDASWLQGVAMAAGYGVGFVLFAMAFGPLFFTIFTFAIASLVAMAISGLVGATIFVSCLCLYGPFIFWMLLGIGFNIVDDIRERHAIKSGSEVSKGR
jgi:MFS family permease